MLYSKSKTGKIQEWEATLDSTPNQDGHYVITITWGQQGGKTQTKEVLVKDGVNKGKANETTIEQQAKLVLERLYQEQKDKGYVDNISDWKEDKAVDGIPKVMLADKWVEKKHKTLASEDWVTNPKLDGNRCFITKLENGSIRFSSRSGKEFTTIPHLVEALKDILPVGDIMDGELIIEDTPLQEITGAVMNRDENDPRKAQLRFYWYDYIPKDKSTSTYKERFIDNPLKQSLVSDKVYYVSPDLYTDDTFKQTFSRYIEEGYEGLMLRNVNMPYEFGKRSKNLLKYKEFFTEEFKILDIIDSDQEPGQPRFICALGNGNEVTVRIKGNKEHNTIYLNNKSDYVGKWLTVQFQAWTDNNTSIQFPVGIEVRDGVEKDGKFIPDV